MYKTAQCTHSKVLCFLFLFFHFITIILFLVMDLWVFVGVGKISSMVNLYNSIKLSSQVAHCCWANIKSSTQLCISFVINCQHTYRKEEENVYMLLKWQLATKQLYKYIPNLHKYTIAKVLIYFTHSHYFQVTMQALFTSSKVIYIV